MSEPRVIIASCTYDRPCVEHLESLSRSEPQWPCAREVGHMTAPARAHLTIEALRAGASHVMFIDDDIAFPPDAISQLLTHKLPIVAGHYYARRPPYQPLLLKLKPNSTDDLPRYTDMKEWTPNSLVEVDATGAGFLLIETEVFRDITEKLNLTTTSWWTPWGTIGEDIAFCWRAQRCGYKIFVDTSIPLKHMSLLPLDEEIAKLLRSRLPQTT